jgi:ATP-dependent helicase IRC3
MVASLAKGIITTPTLFGLDPYQVVKEATAATMKEMKTHVDDEAGLANTNSAFRKASSLFTGKVTFTHFDSVSALIENTDGERHIRGISRLAWVQVDDKRYILSDRSGSFLTLQIQESDFLVTFTQRLPIPAAKSKTPYMRPAKITTASTFEHAINAADTFAKRKFIVPMIMTSAAWRRTDATPEQLAFLNKFREEGNKLQPGSINKGSAMDWITKLKHGARGRFRRMQTEQAKAQKARERAADEYQGVGPIRRECVMSKMYGEAAS